MAQRSQRSPAASIPRRPPAMLPPELPRRSEIRVSPLNYFARELETFRSQIFHSAWSLFLPFLGGFLSLLSDIWLNNNHFCHSERSEESLFDFSAAQKEREIFRSG